MELTDDELITQYREGDRDAFDVLFARHHLSVYRYARLLLGGPEGADDMLQESFLSLARAARRYEPRGHFKTWLLRIVRNRCLNHLKALRVRRNLLRETSFQDMEPPSSAPTPEIRAQASEELEQVQTALLDLPRPQREALACYAFEGLTYRETAEIMNVPLSTVKTFIHRGRSALVRAMTSQAEEDGHDL